MTGTQKVVVIGGAGFLGSHLSDALSADGYRVMVFDICESNYLRPDQEMVVGDILDLAVLTQAVKDARYVYHLAAIADIEAEVAESIVALAFFSSSVFNFRS